MSDKKSALFFESATEVATPFYQKEVKWEWHSFFEKERERSGTLKKWEPLTQLDESEKQRRFSFCLLLASIMVPAKH